jgi:hypothetical protein
MTPIVRHMEITRIITELEQTWELSWELDKYEKEKNRRFYCIASFACQVEPSYLR